MITIVFAFTIILIRRKNPKIVYNIQHAEKSNRQKEWNQIVQTRTQKIDENIYGDAGANGNSE